MNEEAVNAAIAALARADLPGEPEPAEALLRKAALRRQLERAARGPAALNGLPAVLAGVCAIAILLLLAMISAGLSPVVASASWMALAMVVLAAVASSVQLFSWR